MPPKKQQTLNLPKTRRHTKQGKTGKTLTTDGIIQIGSQTQREETTKENLRIHQEHLDETDKMLREFDLNYAYGPCVGINRIDRWERANSLGLRPPQVIKDILLRDKREKYKDSLFSEFPMI